MTPRRAADRPLTFIEQARRAQLIAVTIDLIARHGYAQCSLQRIADAAGVTKAAVIYHFASKAAVVRAAYESVIGALTAAVGAGVAAAPTPAAAVEAYVTTIVGHLAANPTHVRVIVEAIAEDETDVADRPDSPQRWQGLADLIAAAHGSDVDARTLAIVVNGAIDGIVAEWLRDPGFDLPAATDVIVRTIRAATAP